MDLPLNQLVYTRFSSGGFGLLTSEQVPLHIEQTFLKQVVYRYWNALEHKNHSYRAAYLLQMTPEDWLFGWLYNDERDDIDRTHIPHFICYHLREPVFAFCIEKICACLQKGPVELVDHHSLSNSLKPLILKDVSSYQEARPGVLISWEVRQQIHINLKQGKMTDLFIPAKEHERLIDVSLPLEPQQVIEDKSADHGSSIPLIPVKEHERFVERSLPLEPQQVLAEDKSSDHGSLAINRKSILLLGIGFGIITSLIVTVFIFVFLNVTSVFNKPTQSPSQNALPRIALPTTKISIKP